MGKQDASRDRELVPLEADPVARPGPASPEAEGRAGADVFVSYSRRDADFAWQLHAFLTKRGKDVWIDAEDIPASAPWRADIAAAIDAADNVVFVVSPDSLRSDECAHELEHAEAHGKRIVPIVCREADPGAAPHAVAELNWIFARDGDDRDAALETLVRAIETDLEWLRAHTRLLVRAVEWDSKNRDGSLVLRGTDLQTAERLLADHAHADPAPTALQREYVLLSRQASSRRQRITLGAVVVALGVSVSLGVLFLFQRNTANERARVASSRELATSSVGQLGNDPELALILAKKAVETKTTTEAIRALRRALGASHTRVLLHAPRPLMGAAVRDDGRAVAAVDDQGHSDVWTLADAAATGGRPSWSGRIAAVPGGERWLDPYGRGRSAALAIRRRPTVDANATIESQDWTAATPDGFPLAPSPSGARGVAIYCGGVWLVKRGESRGPFLHGVSGTGGDCSPYQAPIVRFSPDERLVALAGQQHRGDPGTPETTSGDSSLRVFDTSSAKQVAELRGHSGYVGAIAFSPDGKLIASGGDDGTARVWEARTGEELLDLRGHRAAVTSVVFGLGGRELFTASKDGTIRSWDISAAPRRFQGVDSAISADGEYAATVGQAGEVRVWRMVDGLSVGHVNGPRPGIPRAFVGIAEHGTRVVVGGKTIRVPGGTRGPTFDPGLNLTVSADGKWALGTYTELHNLQTGAMRSLGADRLDEIGAFSADDSLIAIIGGGDFEGGSAGDEVRLWKIPGGRLIHRFHTKGGWATTVAVSADDRLVAAGDSDGGVSVWDAESFDRLAQIPAHDSTVTALAFDAESDLLASAADDGTVHLWEPRTGSAVASLSGHRGVVRSVAFSPDGNLVVTGGADGSVRVWDAATGEMLLSTSAGAAVAQAAFVGESRFVVAALANGSVIRYSCDACGSIDDLLTRARSRITRPLTTDERRRYLHRS